MPWRTRSLNGQNKYKNFKVQLHEGIWRKQLNILVTKSRIEAQSPTYQTGIILIG